MAAFRDFFRVNISRKILFLIALLSIPIFFSSFLYLLLILVGGLSNTYKLIIRFPLGLELTTFFTVCIFFADGFLWAAIAAALMILISTVINGEFNHVPVVRFSKYLVLLLLCLALSFLGVVAVGKIVTIFSNLILMWVSYSMIGGIVLRAVPGLIFNIVLNFFLFANYGVALVALLA